MREISAIDLVSASCTPASGVGVGVMALPARCGKLDGGPLPTAYGPREICPAERIERIAGERHVQPRSQQLRVRRLSYLFRHTDLH